MHRHINQQNHGTYHEHQKHDYLSHTTLPPQLVRTFINATLIRIIKTKHHHHHHYEGCANSPKI